MQVTVFIVAALLCSCVFGQQAGTNTAEVHPNLPSQYCTNSSGCQTQQTSVVLDSNWRWVHSVPGYTNCYTGNTWNTQLCPDPQTCAANCALDGANYEGTYGISTQGDTLTLGFVTGSNVGSRNYLMASESEYQVFHLKNREFAFDVDVSQLPCGLNGALYFVEMPADGGASQYPTNKAGAAYGTGYCDAQCPSDLKFIDGQANVLDWQPDSNNPNAGTGFYGSCCNELDIWEANSVSAAYTPHACSVSGLYRCNGTDCGDGNDRYNGVCDKDGCDYNSFRMGDPTFYGPGMTVDTTKPFTVVTQFFTDDGTDTGDLAEIRRLYVQNGKVIENSATNIPGMQTFDAVSDGFCNAQKTAFGDPNQFEAKGGLTAMGQSMDRGHVLVMSLWDDYSVDMLWLDSDYPLTKTPGTPGVARGTCATSSGKPSYVESTYPNAYVKYGNIKWGDHGSTFSVTL